MAENGEVERYRQALYDAFQQLDWCIGYLHGIRKTEIASVLAKNRSYIASQVEEGEDEQLPTAQTTE
ncbi:MAG: hypothetical protein ICV64_01480 [Thermoleophilia bacterium]|nr:hypothetical protein [Thermoleophilia bacterium]